MQKHQEHFQADVAADPMTAADVWARVLDRKPSPFDPNPNFALVVDDAPLIVVAIKAALEQLGYIVITASDGIEAIELVPMFPFSTIITDIEMPNCDGIEATRLLRANGCRIPIIAYSGYQTPLPPVLVLEYGFDAFVSKREPLDRLLETVKALAQSPGDKP